jgi:hypothetical protein
MNMELTTLMIPSTDCAQPNNEIGIGVHFNTVDDLVLIPIQFQSSQYRHPNRA